MSVTVSDPARLMVLHHALGSVPDEMGATLHRSSYTTVIKDLLDYSCAIFDARGRLVAQAAHIPSHLGSMGAAMKEIVRRNQTEIREGDVFLTNDPYAGGTHTPDIHVFRPVFSEGSLLGFVGNIAHHGDWGGRVPGTISGTNRTVYEEGVIYPGVKLYEQGHLNEALYQVIGANIRQPALGLGDLRAQIAAADCGVRCFEEIATRFGPSCVEESIQELIEYSAQRTSMEINRLPDGIYRAEGYLDGDGSVPDNPVRITATVTVTGSELKVDFAGSASQTDTGINCPVSTTRSAVYFGIRSLLDKTIPANEGCFRAVEVVAPAGSILNPRFPAAVSDRHLTSQRAADAVVRALAMAAPEKMTAGWSISAAWISCFAESPKTGERLLLLENIVGGSGAAADRDGLDAVDAYLSSCALIPAEMVETNYPLRVDGYRLKRDSGGAGEFRGGRGMIAGFVSKAGEAIDFQGGIEQTNPAFAPWGVAGGKSGKRARFLIKRAGESSSTEIFPRDGFRLEPGDELIIETSGGGGYGCPTERAPEAVSRDVVNGIISAKAARDEYGVIIEENSGKADLASTAALRRALR